MYKQIIIARKDLGMSPGKLAAQVSHGSMAFLTTAIRNNLFPHKDYQNEIDCYKFYNYGKTLVEVAHNLFKLLRLADKDNGEVILIEAVEPNGLGLAIMNRLIRTCEYNYIT